MVFEIIFVITLIMGVWLSIWQFREVEHNSRTLMKLSLVVFISTVSLLIIFSSGREGKIASITAKVEEEGGVLVVKSRKWVKKLPGQVKDLADHIAGKEEIMVSLRNTDARDISYLRDLPVLNLLDVRGTYITDYQIKHATRKFGTDCQVLK